MNSLVLVFLVTLLVLFCVIRVDGFEWDINHKVEVEYPIRVTEGHMFGTNQGPPLLELGSSYIELDNTVTTYAKHNDSTIVHAIIYGTDEEHADTELMGICDNNMQTIRDQEWAHSAQMIKLHTLYYDHDHVYDYELNMNSSYFIRKATVHYRFHVMKQGWYNVLFVLCQEGQVDRRLSTHSHRIGSSTTTPSSMLNEVILNRVASFLPTSWTSQSLVPSSQLLTVTGSQPSFIARAEGHVAFKNPYGFLPGELYGLLPFEAARSSLYFVCFCYFLIFYFVNRDSLLPLHNALLIVAFLALVESALWCASYYALNGSGVPYCCPYPDVVIASLIFQVLRQTLSRTLLLVVCLGYGIVRPKLLWTEWLAISVMTVLYLIAALTVQAYFIISVEHRTDIVALKRSSTGFEIPEFIIDVLFLTWIHFAISSTIRILTEFKQTAKLQLYQTLVKVIVTFVGLFTIVSILFILDDNKVINWPWQFQWLQQVLWETLNFSILAALGFICRPAPTSRLLAYASQLPTEDLDEDTGSNSILDDDDEEDGEFEMVGYDKFHKDRKPIGPVRSPLSRSKRDEDKAAMDRSTHNKTSEDNYDSLPSDGGFEEDDDEEYALASPTRR